MLDDGAGCGQSTGLIKSKHPLVPVTSSDISNGMLETLVQNAEKEGWAGNLRTVVQDAQNLDAFEDCEFSHVFCTFVISFVEDPQEAVQEMVRVVRPGGVVGVNTWGRVSWVPVWETAVQRTKEESNSKAPSLFHPATTNAVEMKKVLGKMWT